MDARTAIGAPLTVTLRRPPGALVVRPEGELDHDSVGPLREALERAVADPPARLVVDCGGLDFCDSTGLNLLLRANAALQQAGVPLLVAAPGRVMLQILEITGADEVLAVRPTVEDALTDGPAGNAAAPASSDEKPAARPGGGGPSGGTESGGAEPSNSTEPSAASSNSTEPSAASSNSAASPEPGGAERHGEQR
ncbi:STAS domain-containing protein [Kitasatospora sp. NPDC048407]|uniref:STAS domain-containing protein n=1 Tax=Kitasatospora sp. NPDC048407 TaxID=3364051 RepID=UPI00371B4835